MNSDRACFRLWFVISLIIFITSPVSAWECGECEYWDAGAQECLCDDGASCTKNGCPGECDECTCVCDSQCCSDADCPNCYSCIDCSCQFDCAGDESCCETGEICCDDGSCALPCDEEQINPCAESMNDDCVSCYNLPYLCNNTNKYVYTGNQPYFCWSGCPGDCHEVEDIHCYTKYKCIDEPDYLAICDTVQVEPGVYEWKCVAGAPWNCYDCIRDPKDPGHEEPYESSRCQ